MAEELTIDQIDLDDEYENQPSGNEDFNGTETDPEPPMQNAEENQDEPGNNPDQPQHTEDEEPSVLDLFLKTKGIQDASQIKFQDEEGNLYTKDWDELSAEEQYNILNSTTEADEDTALDEYEIGLINELRKSGLTPDEFLASIRKNGVDEYLKEQEQKETYQEYDINELTDDEIYALDLQSRIENITDDELREIIEAAKSNSELYTKQVAGIRKEYQKLIEDNQAKAAQEREQQQSQQEQEFRNSIIDSVSELSNMGLPIELDNNDLEQIADHILEKDITGTTAFGRAFNDPKSVAKMAFYNMYGDTIINDIVSYFQNEISKVSQAQYDRGFTAGQKNQKKGGSARFAYRPTQKDVTPINQIGEYTIDDLDN